MVAKNVFVFRICQDRFFYHLISEYIINDSLKKNINL